MQGGFSPLPNVQALLRLQMPGCVRAVDSLCKKHHWPTYDPNCPDWEEKEEDNWAKREFERRKQEKEKEAAGATGGGNEET